MINDEERRIIEKLDFFFQEQVPVHISKKDKIYYNGVLKEKKSDAVFLIDDRVLGLTYLFVTDIFEVEEFKGEVRE